MTISLHYCHIVNVNEKLQKGAADPSVPKGSRIFTEKFLRGYECHQEYSPQLGKGEISPGSGSLSGPLCDFLGISLNELFGIHPEEKNTFHERILIDQYRRISVGKQRIIERMNSASITMKYIGTNIRRIRKDRNFGQKEMAEQLLLFKISMSVETYVKIERGIRNVGAS